MAPRTASPSLAARRRSAPADGIVRVDRLMGLPELVRDPGSDSERIFAHVGFDPARFADPDFGIAFVAEDRLLARCVTAAGCGHLGLLLGERAAPSSLAIQGTTFRRELEGIRYEVACQLLADGAMPLSKIAAALHYADSPAFIRAFKRWPGMSPAQWRRRHGGG